MVYNLINGQVMARPYIATIIHIIRPLKSPDFFEILQINPVRARPCNNIHTWEIMQHSLFTDFDLAHKMPKRVGAGERRY